MRSTQLKGIEPGLDATNDRGPWIAGCAAPRCLLFTDTGVRDDAAIDDDPWIDGYDAARRNAWRSENPYFSDTECHELWDCGWKEGRERDC